jgi:hypothetical protein
MKTCTQCGEQKPRTEFYARQANCKSCYKARVKRRRLTNPKVQEYDRLRYQRPERKTAGLANAARWNAKHPLAYKAHYLVSNAIRDKRLFKQPCTICGSTEHVHGHHRDYTKPLDVTWLCVRCHLRVHAAFPELSAHHSESGAA